MSIMPSDSDETQPKRKPISRRLRYEILRRDNNTCRYCHATDSPLTIDHVIPVALGGTDEPSNLVAACKDCNSGKTSISPDSPLVAQATADALRWSAAMQVAAGLALDEVERVNAYVSDIDAAWSRWGGEGSIGRPGDWTRSARHWYSAGLPVALVVDAIELAMSNRQVVHSDVWRYACGIVWRRIEKMRQDASEIIAQAVV